jgi:hypothetical protein
MNYCACCMKPLPIHHTNNRLRPVDYCDCICLAAHQTLSALALKIWRANCWMLDVSPLARGVT